MIEQEIAQIVCLLIDVQGLMLTPEHKKILRRLIEQNPSVDVKAVIENWVAGTADKPLDKKSRPGSQWVTWVRLAANNGWSKRKASGVVVKQEQQQSKHRLIHW